MLLDDPMVWLSERGRGICGMIADLGGCRFDEGGPSC